MAKYTVDVETANGNSLIQFQSVEAESKIDAMRKVRSSLKLSAEKEWTPAKVVKRA